MATVINCALRNRGLGTIFFTYKIADIMFIHQFAGYWSYKPQNSSKFAKMSILANFTPNQGYLLLLLKFWCVTRIILVINHVTLGTHEELLAL